ncbi:hypothetical protein Tco_1432074, partial [Tanacetum coccineum]
MYVDVVRNDGIDIDPEIQAEIDECIAYTDTLRDRGIDARVVVKAIDREEIKTGYERPKGAVEVMYKILGDLVQRFHDHTEEIPIHRVQVIKSVQRDQGHMIIATGQQSADMLERIRELERDNKRLRDMMDVASQRVTQSQRRELCVQREMRQIQLTMPNTRSGATMTREAVNELIARRVTEALEARDAARNLEPLVEGGGEQEEENGDNYKGGNGGGNRNGGVNGNGVNGNKGVNGNRGVNDNGNRGGNKNGNGNGNGGGNGYNFRGFMPVARECTYQ